MKDIADIQGKYSGECFIMGNGPTLNQYPDDFLMSRPRFAVNYFPYYHKTVEPTFWACWDSSPLEDMLPVVIKRGIIPIINVKEKDFFERKSLGIEGSVYWWKNEENHKGFGFNGNAGVTYTSSIHWAAQIALFLLGFTTLWVVGFDSTTGSGTYKGRGIGAVPHFYDAKEGEATRYQAKWDTQWGDMIRKYEREQRGFNIVNLSVGSKAKVFKAEDWRPYYAKV